MGSTTDVAPAPTDSTRSGFLPDRIIHLHPTRQCNLACLHCYSESGPNQRGALNPASVTSALEVLRAEGYEVVSLSGGEPLVYRDIGAVVGSAKQLGFRVTMITNGLLVNGRNAAVVSELDGMAISFDGLAETHDVIRARPGALRLRRTLRRRDARGPDARAAASLQGRAAGRPPPARGQRSGDSRRSARAGGLVRLLHATE